MFNKLNWHFYNKISNESVYNFTSEQLQAITNDGNSDLQPEIGNTSSDSSPNTENQSKDENNQFSVPRENLINEIKKLQ